jgi:hypothetical protein
MKSTFRPALVTVAVALAGCGLETDRSPLTVVDQKPAAGTTAQPTGATTQPDPGTGGTTAQPGGASTQPGDPPCWAGQLPAEAQPALPKLGVDGACELGRTTSDWSFPTTWTGTNAMRNDDHRANIVGRWATCDAQGFTPKPHAGIEFGANGRYQLLARDPSGALGPTSPPVRGYYYLLGSGQLDVSDENLAEGTRIFRLTFAPGEDTLRFEDSGLPAIQTIYARTTPSPSNGDDNVPSVSDGRCSMVGDWDVPPNEVSPVAPASTWSFDDRGNFVVGPRGSNLCAPPTMWGTYRLSADGGFQIATNWNLGLCDWWFSAAYPASFDATCAHVTLQQRNDGCTGGRGYLNGTTTLTRRP